jgi:hypothetical protein
MVTSAVTEAQRPTQRWIVAFGVLTFQVDATDKQAAKDGAREQFRALLHREPVIGASIIDWAPLT